MTRPRAGPLGWATLVFGLCASACAGAGSPTFPSPSPTIAPTSVGALQDVKAAAAKTLELTAAVSLDFSSQFSKPITGQGTFDFAAARGRARIEQPAGAETAVFLPTVLFDDPPAPDAVGLPRGRAWIMAEPAEHIANATSFAQFVLQMQGKDPMFLLAQVAWGAVSAAPVRSQTIGGVVTSGYLVEVDLAKAAASATGAGAAALSSTMSYEAQGLDVNTNGAVPSQQVRAWVDPSGRVVRLQSSPPGSGVGTTTMTVTAFGGRVDPSRPARNRTVDLASLAPGGDYDRD